MSHVLFLLALFLFADAAFAETLRVVTFNVRYPNPDDGPDVWDKRKDILIRTVEEMKPDVMGTQELFQEQGDYIVQKLPQYAWFGRTRKKDGPDEQMGVFYRKDRLRLLDSGHFWLSETPDDPGSVSWNMSLPRMVTWGQFQDLQTKRSFYFANTHFAHRPQDDMARQRSARVILDHGQEVPEGASIILTGDFNTGAGSEPHRLLTGMLKDSREAAAQKEGPTGTFHGFKGEPGTARIDWILYRGNLQPLESRVVTRNEQGRYPSDHFPVLAVFEVQASR